MSGKPRILSASGAHPDAGIRTSVSELIRLRGTADELRLARQRKVLAPQAGGYLSAYRGRGMDFDETRVYQPGDDVRNIDWRVTARSGVAHTKVYAEERERPVLLLVDLGRNMAFGTKVAFKSVIAARAAALLTWASVDNGDRVGAVIYTADRHRELRPTGRTEGALRIVKALADASSETGRGDLAAGDALNSALERLARITRPGSLVFMLSDFSGLDHASERHLARMARHNDLIAVLVHDPLEASLPEAARYPFSDGHATFVYDATTATARNAYRNRFDTRLENLQRACRKYRAHCFSLATSDPIAATLRHGLNIAPYESRRRSA